MKILSSFFVLLLLIISCEKKSIIDNKKLFNDSVFIESKYEKVKKRALNYSKINKKDSAIFCMKNFVVSDKSLNSNQLGSLYYRIGLSFIELNKEDSAYVYITKSLEEYLKNMDSIKIAKRLYSISKIESRNELYEKSYESAIKGLGYLIGKKDEIKTSLYNRLGINERKRKNYKNAIFWYTKALNEVRDRSKRITYLNNIANIYNDQANHKLALKYLTKAIESPNFDNIKDIEKNRISDNYYYTIWLNYKDKKVLNKLQEIERNRKNLNDNIGLNASYSHLSHFFEKLNNKESLSYAYKMYELAIKENNIKNRIDALRRIIRLERGSKLIKYVSEKEYLQDSIFEIRSKSKVDVLRVVYNLDKEKYKRAIVEKELAENRLETEQQKSQKQLWIFTVILTILSSIVYFFYKREKNKKEKAIEVYNTETRLAKKIHDELANDVYAVMNTLQNTSITDERLLTRVEKIYAQTRDISHENSPVLTGEHFENFLKQLFLDFTNDRCKVIHKGLQEVNINQLAKEKQIVVYRVLQELLVNMKKYSESSLVLITFSIEKNMLHVAYQDNGKGIENLVVKNGLQNMETRIKSVGGFITFESKQGKGFQAKFQFKK